MYGLIWKDIINLKRYIKIFAVFFLVYGFMAFAQKDISFITGIFTLMFAILTMSTYSYDEMSQWDVYALTMPITRKDIVRGKYMLMLLLVLFGSIFSAVFAILINAVIGSENIFAGIGASFIGAAVVILFYSILLPFITKLGIEKARIILFVVCMVPFVIVIFIKKAVNTGVVRVPDQMLQFCETAHQYQYLLMLVVLVVCLSISYFISLQIYHKKEF
jgi:ABC-type transport system involved in multi-copper enzyme maturation permease subunit